MYKLIFYLLLLSSLISCKEQAYFHFKLNSEIKSEVCEGGQPSISMNSNINGDRYEFDKCLAGSFTKDKAAVTRQGDTLRVIFDKPLPGEKQSLFHIILDIDTYPRYHFLTIDGETFPIIPAGG